MENNGIPAKKLQSTIETDSTMKEQRQHGTPEFPLAVYHDSLRKRPLGYISWHWHPELQFVFITTGQVRYFINDASVLLNPGDGLLINSGRLHMAESIPGTDGSYVCLDFHPSLLSGYPGSVFEQKYVQPVLHDPLRPFRVFRSHEPEQKCFTDMFLELIRMYEEAAPGYELHMLADLLSLWRKLLDSPAVPVHTSTSPLVKDIMSYVSSHLQEPMSLTDLSAAAGFSPAECCRQFKQVTGDTIFAFIRKSRLAYALSLLQNTDLSVTEIAYAAGFSGSSHFISSFRDALGTTPHQYRKTLKTGA